MSAAAVTYDVTPTRVATIRLNRPESLNAISLEMSELLGEFLESADRDENVGCVVLTGAGRGFCAGGDLGTMTERDGGKSQLPDFERQVAERELMHQRVPLRLHELSKPTIAAVNGGAAGAGLSLAAACDIRIASADAKLTTAFARVGRSGDFGGTFFLTRLLGPSKSRELYFSSEVLSAEQAMRIGLVDHVFPAGQLQDEVNSMAVRIASGPPGAIARMKEAFRIAEAGDLRTLLAAEARLQAMSSLGEEGQEFLARYLESRAQK